MDAETLGYSLANKQSAAPQQIKSQWNKLTDTGTEVGYVMSNYVRRDFALDTVGYSESDETISTSSAFQTSEHWQKSAASSYRYDF